MSKKLKLKEVSVNDPYTGKRYNLSHFFYHLNDIYGGDFNEFLKTKEEAKDKIPLLLDAGASDLHHMQEAFQGTTEMVQVFRGMEVKK